MNQLFTCLTFQVLLISYALLLYCCEGTSILLSPLGMVSVCPGGQVLLTCERMSGSLQWDVSVPRMAGATTQTIIVPASPGVVLSPDFKIDFTEFNVTRTSDSPLTTSQLLINNVTTEINGSRVYCSEDGDKNNAPMSVINVKYKDDVLDCSLNVTMVNQLLRSDDVTVTLQWPREPGAVYSVSVSPQTPHTALTNAMIIMINLTVSYNIQYNVSIVSSLCGVTTTKVLKYVTCDYPPLTQVLNHPVVVVSESQDSPPIEGQSITYTCPPGFNLIGPNASECTGNREWEPDPGEVDCIANCGSLLVNRNIKLNYISTPENFFLTLTCENEMFLNSTTEMTLSVICHSNGSWIPNPVDFIQSCSPFSTTVSPTTDAEILIWTPVSSILIAVCAIISIVFLSIGYACGWFSQKHKQSRSRKATSDSSVEENTGPNEGSQLPQIPGPLYEELSRSTPEHQDLVELKENVAYGPIVK